MVEHNGGPQTLGFLERLLCKFVGGVEIVRPVKPL